MVYGFWIYGLCSGLGREIACWHGICLLTEVKVTCLLALCFIRLAESKSICLLVGVDSEYRIFEVAKAKKLPVVGMVFIF